MAEEKVDPNLTTEELIQQVFANPFGHELLTRWMALAGLTEYKHGTKDHETLIRRDELQRFFFSVMAALELTPEQIYAVAQRKAEMNNLVRQQHTQHTHE